MTKKIHTQKGFTLIEMMISIFIFVIVMTASVSVFVSHIKANTYARTVQRNLENAQFAFNFIAKTLRTSAIATTLNGVTVHTDGPHIYLYDYSQSACFHFAFTSTAITYRTYPLAVNGTQDIEQCGDVSTYTGPAVVGPIDLTTGKITGGQFVFTPSQRGDDTHAPVMGYVTMAASIEDATQPEGHVWIQTSVSLRDYPGELSF